MNHEELVERLERRLETIETKLDKYAEISINNQKDISWLSWFVKTSVTTISTIMVGVVGGLLTWLKQG